MVKSEEVEVREEAFKRILASRYIYTYITVSIIPIYRIIFKDFI